MKIKILAAGIALTLPFWACAKDVTIIYTNDLHAHVEPYKVPWIADGKRDIGGWANITTLVKQEKAKNKAKFDENEKIYLTFSIEKNSISRYNTKCKIELEKRCIRRR